MTAHSLPSQLVSYQAATLHVCISYLFSQSLRWQTFQQSLPIFRYNQTLDMMAAPASMDAILRVVYHVFLPPKLPQRADEDSEIAIVDITLQALFALRDLMLPESLPEAIKNAIALLENIKVINSLRGGTIDETGLNKILTSLPIGRALAANVRCQNAAVLITRKPGGLVFEEFELSPLDAAVIETEGRLTRTFPGMAVVVPSNVLEEANFAIMVASTLSTMCHQQVPGMQ